MLGYALDSRQARITLARNAICIALLSALVFAASRFIGRRFVELSFRNPVEISMLGWTSGFLKLFTAILLAEACRSSNRRVYAIIACAFLIMGFFDLAYSLNFPGSSKAAWIKTISLLAASLVALSSLPAYSKNENSFPKTCVKYFLPSIIFCAALIFSSGRLEQFLPSSIASDGLSMSELAKFVLATSFGLFMVAMAGSILQNLEDRTRECRCFPFLLFSFAIISYLTRESRTWDIIWWVAHLLDAIVCLAASLFLLSYSMKKSLTWRLMFSLAFIFSLAILLASGITQAVIGKKMESEYRRILYAKHLRQVFKYRMTFEKSSNLLRLILESKDSGAATYVENHGELAKFQLHEYMRKILMSTESNILELGLFDGTSIVNHGECGVSAEKKHEIFSEILSRFHRLKKNDVQMFWSPPVLLRKENKYVSFVCAKAPGHGKKHLAYLANDVTEIVLPSILAAPSANTAYSGRIIIDAKSARPLSQFLPGKYFDEYRKAEAELPSIRSNSSKVPLLRIIVSTAMDSKTDGISFLVNLHGRSFTTFSTLMNESGWILADILDNEALSLAYRKSPTKYIVMAVGMITLLLGILMLLLLLESQIGIPLKKIMSATQGLESGNFNTRINSRLENELGTLSNSFDSMAEHLQQSYEELKKAVHEKTMAYDELEKSAIEKSRFFTLLSHELRTPLHAILSFSRLGQNRYNEPEKTKNYFIKINEGGQRLLAIIDEMLETAKIKSGQIEYSFSKNNLFLLIVQISEEMKACFEEKNIKFVCHPPQFSTDAVFDREKIGRVLRNIISNALKLSPENSKIEVHFSDSPPEMISVEIRDRGPGIPPDDIKRIFDEFFQSESGKKTGGTGLGLHICRLIVEKHGGTIYAFNNPDGKGASVGFAIPINSRKT